MHNRSRVHLLKELNIPLAPKLALLSYDTSSFPKYLLPSQFLFSQIQLFGIILQISLLSLKHENLSFSWILRQVQYGLFLQKTADFDGVSDITFWLLHAILIYFALLTLLLTYISYTASRNIEPIRFTLKLWTFIRFLHPMIIFYGIHIFTLQVLDKISNGQVASVYSSKKKRNAEIIACVALAFNVVFAFLVELFLSINLSAKNPLASKSRIPNIMDLLFKTFMPILIIFINLSKPWCFTLLIISLLYCLLRTAAFFYLLPYYKIFILKLFNWVQALTTSLILASIISKIIFANRDIGLPVGLFLLIWSLLATFTIKLYQNLLHWLFFKIVKSISSTNIYHFLHYTKIFKYFQNTASLHIGQDKINKNLFDSIALIKGLKIPNLEEIFEDNSSLVWNKETKEKFYQALQELFLHQLRQVASKNPNIPLIQATFAYCLAKQNSTTSVIAHDIAAENLKTCSFINQNYFYLIQVLLLEKLKATAERNDTNELFNAKEILNNYTEYQNTKNSIRIQLDLQLEFWDSFAASDEKVQLTTLLSLCEQIHKQSKIAQHEVDQLLINTKTGFFKPYIISSFYYSFLQNDAVKAYFCYSNYISSLAQSFTEKQQHPESTGGLYFLISATDKQKGMILDYFGKLGEDTDIPRHRNLTGDSLSKIFPSMYASKFEEFFKAFLESHENNILQLPVLTNDHCLLPCSITFNFIYQPTYGLCIYALVKPLVNNTRQVIVSGSGQILYCCKTFLKDMNLEDAAEMHGKQITEFCPDLFKILERLTDKESIQKLRRGTLKRPMGSPSIDQDFLAFSLSKEYNLTFFNSANQASNTLRSSSTQKKFKQFSVQITGIPFSGVSAFWFDISLKRISREGYSSSALVTHSDSAMPPLPPEITKTTTLEGEDWYTTTKENAVTLPIIRQDSPPLVPKDYILTTTNKHQNIRILTHESSSPRHLTAIPIETIQSGRFLTSPMSERGDLLLQSEMRTETNLHMSPSNRGRRPVLSFFSSRSHPEHDDDEIDLKLANNLTLTERNLFYEALSWSMINDNELGSRSNGQKYTRHKQLRSILNSRKYSTMTLIYNFCFIFTFCFLFGNLAWLNVKVSKTSKEVNVLSQVVQDMYFRNYWIKIALREVHYWQAYVDQLENYDLDLLTGAFTESFSYLRTASKSLIDSTSQLNEDLQTLFYQKRVSVFTQSGQTILQSNSKFDTFQATSLLFSNMFQLADFINMPTVSQPKFDQTVLLIVDNSMNDLLLVSSDLIQEVRSKLFDSIEFAQEQLRCIFIGYSLDIMVFILLSFLMVMQRNKASKKFIDTFTTLSPLQIGSIKDNLMRFRTLLNEGSNSKTSDAYSRKTKSKKRFPAPQRKSHSNTNISLRKLYQRNFLILFALVLCLAITLGFAIIYYSQALNNVNGIQQQQVNLISALKYLNTISVFNAGLQSMLLFNNITTIEGVPVTTVLLKESHKLLDVTDFQESLKNADGSLPKYQWNLLYNLNCEDLYSKYNTWSLESLHYACNLIADGTGQVSFMKTFLQLNSVVTGLVQRFADSDRSLASRKPIYSDFYNFYYSYGDVTNVMLFMSFEYSTNNFSEMVKELGNKSKTLAYLAFVVCAILGVFTWVFVIRRLSRMEFESRKMLTLIPDKYVLANFLMKKDLGLAQ